MTLHVDSEVGPLRQAILHRPDLELKRLTPTNKDAYLFDDVLWVKRAKQEHDAFAESLRDLGVQVHLLERPAARDRRDPRGEEAHPRRVLRRARLRADGRRRAAQRLRRASTTTPWSTYLIGGMTKRELLEHVEEPQSVVIQALDLDDLFLPPLPNHLFTRDTSAWIYDGVSINSMRMKARMRETVHYEAIYRWHPLFADADFHVWSRGLGQRPGHRRGRRHAGARPRRGAGRDERADHPAGRRAAGREAVRRRQRRPGSSRSRCRRSGPSCTSTR